MSRAVSVNISHSNEKETWVEFWHPTTERLFRFKSSSSHLLSRLTKVLNYSDWHTKVIALSWQLSIDFTCPLASELPMSHIHYIALAGKGQVKERR